MNAVRNGSGFTLPVSRNPDKLTRAVAPPETGRETGPIKKQKLKKVRTLEMSLELPEDEVWYRWVPIMYFTNAV